MNKKYERYKQSVIEAVEAGRTEPPAGVFGGTWLTKADWYADASLLRQRFEWRHDLDVKVPGLQKQLAAAERACAEEKAGVAHVGELTVAELTRALRNYQLANSIGQPSEARLKHNEILQQLNTLRAKATQGLYATADHSLREQHDRAKLPAPRGGHDARIEREARNCAWSTSERRALLQLRTMRAAIERLARGMQPDFSSLEMAPVALGPEGKRRLRQKLEGERAKIVARLKKEGIEDPENADPNAPYVRPKVDESQIPQTIYDPLLGMRWSFAPSDGLAPGTRPDGVL